jgi:hypothetical protein
MRRFKDRADGCFASSGDGESDVGVRERDELDELMAALLGWLGEETNDEPYITRVSSCYSSSKKGVRTELLRLR